MKTAEEWRNLWVDDVSLKVSDVVRQAREEMREACIKAAQPFGGTGIEPAIRAIENK